LLFWNKFQIVVCFNRQKSPLKSPKSQNRPYNT